MKDILLFGLQRSGTNYTQSLMLENLESFCFRNHGYARSLPVHKHFRLYDDKSFVPEPKYLNAFYYPSFTDFDAHVRELTGSADMGYVVVVKEPYSWYISVCKEARKSRWPGHLRRDANNRYMSDYSLFYGKWLDFIREAPERIILVRYEDLLADMGGKLEEIRMKFGLEKKQDPYHNVSKVFKSKRFSMRRKRYYKKGDFTSMFCPEHLLVMTGNLDGKVTRELGYDLAAPSLQDQASGTSGASV